MRELTHEAWEQEAKSRFGEDASGWKFKCPSCGYVATVDDWKKAGAPAGAVAFSCVGRWTGSEKKLGDKTGGPCNYAGGGLFGLNPVRVLLEGGKHDVFEFADA